MSKKNFTVNKSVKAFLKSSVSSTPDNAACSETI